MAALADAFADAAQNLAPVDTGDLKRSIRRVYALPKHSGVGTDVPYAPAQEYGARPHTIAARQAPMLRFYWKKKGRMFVGRRVNHPGNRPQPFFRPVAETFNMVLPLRVELVSRWNRGG